MSNKINSTPKKDGKPNGQPKKESSNVNPSRNEKEKSNPEEKKKEGNAESSSCSSSSSSSSSSGSSSSGSTSSSSDSSSSSSTSSTDSSDYDESLDELQPPTSHGVAFPLVHDDFLTNPQFSVLSQHAERGRIHEWNINYNRWQVRESTFVVGIKSFSKGSMRCSYYCMDLNVFPNLLVAKKYRYKKKHITKDQYFADVHMHSVANYWAEMFNRYQPPKKVRFLPAYVLELCQRPSRVFLAVEPFLRGDFKKHNNNNGYVLKGHHHHHVDAAKADATAHHQPSSNTAARCTPQAFSHFTYHYSSGAIMVVDIQGVGDMYTDPQLLTPDGEGYGRGNLGKKGMQKFLSSHHCNAVCQRLNLPLLLLKQQGDNPQSPSENKVMTLPQVQETPLYSSSNRGGQSSSPGGVTPNAVRKVLAHELSPLHTDGASPSPTQVAGAKDSKKGSFWPKVTSMLRSWSGKLTSPKQQYSNSNGPSPTEPRGGVFGSNGKKSKNQHKVMEEEDCTGRDTPEGAAASVVDLDGNSPVVAEQQRNQAAAVSMLLGVSPSAQKNAMLSPAPVMGSTPSPKPTLSQQQTIPYSPPVDLVTKWTTRQNPLPQNNTSAAQQPSSRPAQQLLQSSFSPPGYSVLKDGPPQPGPNSFQGGRPSSGLGLQQPSPTFSAHQRHDNNVGGIYFDVPVHPAALYSTTPSASPNRQSRGGPQSYSSWNPVAYYDHTTKKAPNGKEGTQNNGKRQSGPSFPTSTYQPVGSSSRSLLTEKDYERLENL